MSMKTSVRIQGIALGGFIVSFVMSLVTHWSAFHFLFPYFGGMAVGHLIGVAERLMDDHKKGESKPDVPR